MGAGQSSGGGASDTDGVEVKTSYYELLGVHRQATEEELKKAYRRKALELHPDRNYGNEESATKTFAEVQAAYEILSDPQERAWYDSHESAILRGDDGETEEVHTYDNIKVTTADDLARVLRRFNSNVEFTDAPSGFFGFLRDQFEHLSKEEEVAAAWDRVEAREYPTFGHKADTHDDVVKQFYTAWANFSTVKSFAWKDKYRLSEAPDRRIRRLMEKENNAFRQEAIREFNEAVRSFVLFVRKRDPRYTPSTQSEAERQKTLRDAAAAQAARARAENQAKMEAEIPEWTKFREPEELEESSEEEVEEEVFECVACDKIFKSERQFEAHEKSKKHQKAIQALQKRMRKDNQKLDLDSEDTSDVATPALHEDDQDTLDAAAVEDTKMGTIEDDSRNDDSNNNEEKVTQNDLSPSSEDEIQSAKADNSPKQDTPEHDSESQEDDDYASPEAIAARLTETKIEQSLDEDSYTESQPATQKMGKAAQKRAKKAAAAAAASTQSETSATCTTCGQAFPSRTRLFQHLKDECRAALKSTPNGSAKGKKGKSKR